MRLKDIIKNLDRSEDNHEDSVYWNLQNLVTELDLDCWDVQQDNPRLQCYWIANHICTDTWVGIRAYFLDNTFVCLSTQEGRKCDEVFKWKDLMSFKNVREYVISLQECKEMDLPSDFLDIEEEFGEGYPIEFTAQCLKKDVLWKGKEVTIVKDSDSGYTNLHTITIEEKETSRQVDIDVREILVPWYTTKSAC